MVLVSPATGCVLVPLTGRPDLLLLTGEIPDLFPDEEAEAVVSAVRPEVRSSGVMDSRDNCWRFFINRVRRQLKVRPSGR